MARVVVIATGGPLTDALVSRLRRSPAVESCHTNPEREDGFGGALGRGYAGFFEDHGIDTVVYSPPLRSSRSMTPDLADAVEVFEQCVRAGIGSVVLLSSAAVYGASPHNPGLVAETRLTSHGSKNPIGSQWTELELLAQGYLGEQPAARLTILRPAAVLTPGGTDYFSRLFRSRIAIALPGHDPSIQLLGPQDLAAAVCCAVETGRGGVYNVAPGGVIPLRAALRLAGCMRVPVPRVLQRPLRAALAPLGLAHRIDDLDYIRYSWTTSDRKLQVELGAPPSRSSCQALLEFLGVKPAAPLQFDDFGMDRQYIAAYGRTLMHFLSRYYWRIESNGIENVPRIGRGVLVGVHRGFMPWDGVMALHLIVQKAGRIPRFLLHPTLVKFPFLCNFMTKLGGIIACQENADYVLERDELLGVYPEGIHGAFTLYRDAYRLGKFGRDEYVKMALRHQAPIIPFVTVGSAEIFPILKRIDWPWWKRFTEWPYFPLTPTFPLVPLPLPSKWHTQFLAAIHLENRYPPEAAEDTATVRAISREVRSRLQEAFEKMLRRRKSIFFGSIFEPEVSR